MAIATGGHFTAERSSKKRDGSQLAPSLEAVVVVLVFLLAVYSPRRRCPRDWTVGGGGGGAAVVVMVVMAARVEPIVVASLFGRVAGDPRRGPLPTTTPVCIRVLDVDGAVRFFSSTRGRSAGRGLVCLRLASLENAFPCQWSRSRAPFAPLWPRSLTRSPRSPIALFVVVTRHPFKVSLSACSSNDMFFLR